MIGQFAGLAVYLIALLGGMSFIFLMPVLLLSALRPWNPHKLVIPSMMVIAFFVGGILSWNLIPSRRRGTPRNTDISSSTKQRAF